MASGKVYCLLLGLILASAFLVKPVFASSDDGTISTGNAWSSKIGWVNFAAASGNVHVTDVGLTGGAWNNLYGWIKLNSAGSGVKNNSEGVLSGSAWGVNIGWVDFSGVSIDANGVFSGTASGANVGTLNFSCAHCLVQTDWRAVSVRNAGQPGAALPINNSNLVTAISNTSTNNTITTTTPRIEPSSSLVATQTFSRSGSVKSSLVISNSASATTHISSLKKIVEKITEMVNSAISKFSPSEEANFPPVNNTYAGHFFVREKLFSILWILCFFVFLMLILLGWFFYKNRKRKHRQKLV